MATWSRRAFLSSCAAGVSIAELVVRAAESREHIKVGFLGTAHSHFKEKYQLLREASDWELVGLCEENDAVRTKGPADARWLTAEELFSRAEVVVVESAVSQHAADARRALQAGKHVHVEKPPADSLKGLSELLQLAADRKRLLQIGYMWRYNPGINLVLEAAREGWLGDIYLVRATMNTLGGAEQRREWARFRGGAMFEQGCHLIDPLIRLLGKPLKVTPHLQHSSSMEDTLADNTVATFEFARALAIITSAPLQPNAGPQRFLEILGTNGTARVQPLEPPAVTIELGRAAGPYRAGRQEVKVPEFRRYVGEFQAFAAAIRGGTPLAVTAAQELEIQEALLRACEML